MKTISVIFIGLFSSLSWAQNNLNVNSSGVILDGYDAVSYFKPNGPIKGSTQFQTKFEDAIYWFATDQNKNEFAKEPKKYAPQFGGWCAYAVADSKSKVEIDPKSFLIQDGKLLVFYNGIWADTKKKWQSTKDKSSAAYLKEAESNWPEVSKKSP